MNKRITILGVLLLLIALSSPVQAATLDLQESINIAIENSLTLESAKKNVNISTQQLNQAKGSRQPKLTLDYAYSKLDKAQQLSLFGQAITLVPQDNYNTKFTLQYPIYSGGQLEAANRAAEHKLNASIYERENVKQQLIYQVKENYYNVLKAQKMVTVARETLTSCQAHLRVAQSMYKVGNVPKYDLLRAQVSVLDAEQMLVQAQNSLELAKSAFNNVLQRNINDSVDLVDASEEVYADKEKTLGQLIDQANQQRYEIKQLDYLIRMAKEGVIAAEGAKKLSVAVVTDYQWKGDKPFKGNVWSVSLVGNLNIFNGGIDDSRIKESIERYEQANNCLQSTKDEISLEVKQSYLKVTEAITRLNTNKKMVEQAKEGLKLAEARFKVGLGTSVERMDSQTFLTNAETSYINSLYDFHLAKAKLQRAVGENT